MKNRKSNLGLASNGLGLLSLTTVSCNNDDNGSSNQAQAPKCFTALAVTIQF
jgi:hypothetical protein